MLSLGSVTINLFSIILLLTFFYLLLFVKSFKKKFTIAYMINVFLEIINSQGFFIAFGTTEVSYMDFWMCIVIFFAIPLLLNGKIYTKLATLCLLMLFAASTGFITELIFPYNGLIMPYDGEGWDIYMLSNRNPSLLAPLRYSVSRFALFIVRFIMQIVCIYILKTHYNKIEIMSILDKLCKILVFFVLYGYFEFFTKFIFAIPLTNDINDFIFGHGSNTASMHSFSGLPRLSGVCRESSHFAGGLFYISILILINKKISGKINLRNLKFIFIIIILMLISRSFAGLLYVCIIALTLILMMGKKSFYSGFIATVKRMKYVIIGSVLLLGILLIYINVYPKSYISSRINMSIESIMSIFQEQNGQLILSSEHTRFTSIYETFVDFLHRPFFGLGVGIQISHGGLVNMFSDIGIVGVIVWCKLILYRFSDKKYDNLIFFVVFILVNSLLGLTPLIYSGLMVLIVESTNCYTHDREINVFYHKLITNKLNKK